MPKFVEDKGDRKFRETADPDADVPRGMCGNTQKCPRCPSEFLCFMKVSKEAEIIKARNVKIK